MKSAGKARNNGLYRHIRTFEKIVKNYFVIYQTYYQVDAQTRTGVKKISVSGVLYEKGTIGTWQKVSSCSNSSTTSTCMVSSSFNTKPGKSYRLEYSATFSYSDGRSETITGSTSR